MNQFSYTQHIAREKKIKDDIVILICTNWDNILVLSQLVVTFTWIWDCGVSRYHWCCRYRHTPQPHIQVKVTKTISLLEAIIPSCWKVRCVLSRGSRNLKHRAGNLVLTCSLERTLSTMLSLLTPLPAPSALTGGCAANTVWTTLLLGEEEDNSCSAEKRKSS